MVNQTYFHLSAFRESLAAGSTFLQVNAVADQILTQSAQSNFIAPSGSRIAAAIGGGVDAAAARINTPSARFVGFPSVAPLGTGTTAVNPPNLAFWGEYGPKPRDADEVSYEAFHSNVGAQVQWGLMWWMFQRRPWTPGVQYRLRWTAAITGVVGSWASGALSFDQTLPSGVYEIQGMNAFGTNLLGARLIFPGGGWRPGVLAMNTLSSSPRREFTDGSFGVFGQFDSVNQPTLEIFVEAANSAQQGFFDLVRVADR